MQIGLHRKEKNMKQAWNDLKSFVTVAFSLTVITLIIIVAINKNWEVFQLVFTLFSSICASVFTYLQRHQKIMITKTMMREGQNNENYR